MTTNDILAYSLTKPGSFVDFPFGPEVTIVKVKSSQSSPRIFVQLFVLNGEEKATFKCDQLSGEYYRSVYPNAVTRGYHCPPVQQPYFNTVNLDGSVPDNELRQMIDLAYTVVISKMPKKAQKELQTVGSGELRVES